jgi:hypothetical protein
VTSIRASRVEQFGGAALVATALLTAVAAVAATASFVSNSASSEAIATGNLSAPTGLTASCVFLSSNVSLSWTATSSAAATGYDVLRSTTNGGPYTMIGSTGSRTATTFTDTIGTLQTQYYVVQATRDDWTSPDSNQAGVESIALGQCNQA